MYSTTDRLGQRHSKKFFQKGSRTHLPLQAETCVRQFPTPLFRTELNQLVGSVEWAIVMPWLAGFVPGTVQRQV